MMSVARCRVLAFPACSDLPVALIIAMHAYHMLRFKLTARYSRVPPSFKSYKLGVAGVRVASYEFYTLPFTSYKYRPTIFSITSPLSL